MQKLYLSLIKSMGPLKLEQLVISRLQYKLSNQMRHLCEFRRLRRLYGLINALIEQCSKIINEKLIQYDVALQLVTEALQIITVIGFKVVQQICKHFLVQFQLITFGILARCHFCILSMQKDLTHFNGIQVSKDNKTMLVEDSPVMDFPVVDFPVMDINLIDQLFEDLKPKQENVVEQLFLDLIPPSIVSILEPVQQMKFVEQLFEFIMPPIFDQIAPPVLQLDDVREEGEVSPEQTLQEEEEVYNLADLSEISEEQEQIVSEQILKESSPSLTIINKPLISQTTVILQDQNKEIEAELQICNISKSIHKKSTRKYKYLFSKQLRRRRLFQFNIITKRKISKLQ